MSAGNSRPVPLRWIIALGDSGLDMTTKVVGYALSTWMDERGVCTPSVPSVARRASVSRPTATTKLTRLEVLGWLIIERSRGGYRKRHEYRAALGEGASDEAREDWKNRKARVSYFEGGNRKARGSKQESQGFRERHSFGVNVGNDDAASDGASPLPEDDCPGCGKRRELVGPAFIYCRGCAVERAVSGEA